MCDLMPEAPAATNADTAAPAKKRPPKQEPFIATATYDYQDEDGKTLYWVCRGTKGENRKSFQQRRPKADGTPGFEWGLHSKAKSGNKERKLLVKYCVPFRLPRVIKAAAEGKSIAILEGEKDVLNFERATGCVATCNSGGAGKWALDWPADWIKWFAGCRSILIIADNDPETKTVVRRVRGQDVIEDKPHWRGQKHAWDVKRKLEAAGYQGQIKLMVMPGVDGAGKVKDFSDWAAARAQIGADVSRQAFAEAVKGAAPWPQVWEFDAEAVTAFFAADSVAKKKRDAHTASEQPAIGAAAEKGGGEQTASANIGRFGFALPPSPDGTKKYGANIHLGRGGVYEIEVNESDDLRMAIAIQCARISSTLSAVGAKMSAKLTNDVSAITCLLWLRARGQFFWRKLDKRHSTSMYYNGKTNVVTNIRCDEFVSFLASASGINRESVTFKYVMAFLDDAAFDDDISQGVQPSNLWECVDGKRIYISSGDSEMYRIEAGKIEKVKNCTDGVVFLRRKTLKPWTLKAGDGVDPFAESMIFKGASFADSHGRMIVRLWFLNLFCNHRKKPPLLITGEYQCGKTKMAESIQEILGLEKNDVRSLKKGDKGEEAFWLTLETKMITIFDNVDSRIDWIKDAMQIASTGGEFVGRRLYTDQEETEMNPNSHIIITSNNPLFTSDQGLSDRMQTVNLNTARKTAAEDILSRDILEHRDDYMTWTARLLAKTLADDQPVEGSINMRHPEFSHFGIRLGRAGGFEDEARGAMGFAELNKALLPLKNDESHIAPEILAVLLDRKGEWQFMTNELVEAIITRKESVGEADEKTREYFNTRRVGRALNKFWRILAVIFKAQPPKLYQGKMRYTFTGLTDGVGQLVGLVDKNGEIPKTPTNIEDLALLHITNINPPNPPNKPNSPNEEMSDDGFDFEG